MFELFDLRLVVAQVEQVPLVHGSQSFNLRPVSRQCRARGEFSFVHG